MLCQAGVEIDSRCPCLRLDAGGSGVDGKIREESLAAPHIWSGFCENY